MPANKGTPPEMITPEEMAPRLGMGADQIRAEIRRGVFPIGWADNPSGKQWVYRIVRAEFELLMAGKLATNPGFVADRVAVQVADQLVERLRVAI